MLATVTGLRRLAELHLPESAAISRPTDSNTGDGVTRTWTTVATVACRVQPLGGSTQTETIGARGGLEASSAWQVSLPATTDVTVRDRLVVGARTFEVAEVFARGYEVVRAVLCREVL